MLNDLLNDWVQQRRLLPMESDREQGVMTAVVLERSPDFGVGFGTPVAALACNMLVAGEMMRLTGSRKEAVEKAADEVRTRAGLAVTDPQQDEGPAQFGDILSETMLFPLDRVERKPYEDKLAARLEGFFEEEWSKRPLKSLGGATPLDAAGHPTYRKRLAGLLRFMEQCVFGTREDGTALYDFDRLRKRLGLGAAGATAEAATPGTTLDFDTMSAADLGTLDLAGLSNADAEKAFRAALKLDAPDLAAAVARNVAARPADADRPDRYAYFNHLIQAALGEGKTADALTLLDQAEKADAEANGGGRANDYGLTRGRALARSGDVDAAYAAFEAVATRSADPKPCGVATEAMLGKKQSARALHFAEMGLAKSRAAGSRDSERYFLELVEAAKKQGA